MIAEAAVAAVVEGQLAARFNDLSVRDGIREAVQTRCPKTGTINVNGKALLVVH